MKHRRWFLRLLAGSLTLGCLAAGTGPAAAVEESQRFLDGLRERGYFDVALEYLEQMRNSPLATQEFKETIDYEAGVTLITASRTGRVTSIREKQLGQARDKFRTFIDRHPDSPLVAGANTQLANLLVERGRIKTEQASKPNRSAEEKKSLLSEARELYQEAEKVFKASEQRFVEEHKKYPKFIDPKQTAEIEKRDQVRRDLLQSRLALATVVYEIAKTYEPGSTQYKEQMTAAAARYADLYEKYGARLAGLYARMWEGRCYKDLGKADLAFEAFNELLSQPDKPAAFRLLKSKSAVLAVETALLPSQKKYKESVALYRAWEKTARPDEDTSMEGLALKCLTAEAALELARSLDKEKDAELYREHVKLAKDLLKFVARYPGEYQKRARNKLIDPLLTDPNFVPPEPKTFADARDRAKAALDRMTTLQLQIKQDQSEGKTENLEKYQRQSDESRQEALKYYRLALSLKTPDVQPSDVNVIRYYMAYLYWAGGDLYESAVVGEFLARRYPSGVGALQGAQIAMAAYVKLFNEAPADDRQFEVQRMVEIAKYITERWEGEPQADEAWMMLIRSAVIDRRLDDALEYLTKIPTDSPRRGEAELMTGQALWAGYLKAARLAEDQRPSQTDLDDMVQRSQKTLEDGISRMRKPVDEGGEVSYTLVASVLSLAQIYIGASEAEKAVKWLDDPKIGALTLVAADNPATDRGNFRVETYKAALRAYVATQQLDKAEEAMNALEKLVAEGGDAGASKRLTKIYISLGRELEEQLKRLRSQHKADQLQAVSAGFELFLTKISKREKGITFNSLNWVAETFFSLGAGFDLEGNTLPPEAKKYYQKAAVTYWRILKLIKSKGFEEPPPAGADTSITIRLANCLSRVGEHKKAMDLLVGVLKVRNTIIDAQVEATKIYQAWGKQKPAYYQLAITGGRKAKTPDGSIIRLVWGWGKIAKRVARSPKHRPVFHEARYNLALCRFKLALSKTGAKKTETLKQARTDILIVQRLHPEMGGPEWSKKYDELLKKVQKMLGVKAVGLKGSSRELERKSKKSRTTASR